MPALMLALALALIVTPGFCFGQAPGSPPPRATSRTAVPPATTTVLPVRRVVLYKTGIGYFEHLGQVRNRQDVTIRFTSAQLNDALKSLTAIDLGQGRIIGINYNSVAPLEQRLGALRLPIGEDASSAALLGALRGARVEVTSGTTTSAGRLLSVERAARGSGADRVEVQGVSIVTDSGDVRSYDLTPAVHVRVVERDLRQEIDRYLDVVASTREQDVRSLSIATDGKGERPLFVSYISEVPIWKSTYRLVLPPGGGAPLLQGWAIVDNTIGEDWRNVELSLVAGAPQSFIQHLSQPHFGARDVIPLPTNVRLSPQTHEGTLRSGASVDYPVPDPSGHSGSAAPAELPGASFGGIVGGIRVPPPAPAARLMPLDRYQQASSADPAAAAASLGDLFEYRLEQPVTLAKNQSALVPILNTPITVEKVALWTGDRPGGAPLRAVWITNSSGLTLDGGSISVIDANAFAGEGLIEPLKPGERRLLSYAAELGMRVRQERTDGPGRVVRVRAQKGVIISETEQQAAWTYTARNENDVPATVLIEHRVRPGWRLRDGQPAAESTLSTHRFRVVVEPKQEAVLVVREVRGEDSRVAITGLDGAWMTEMAQSGVSGPELQRVLQPVIDQRNALADGQRRLDALKAEQGAIATDQQRLRENMKALRGTAEEKLLLQRYTGQLDAQETRLDALKESIARASGERTAADARLAALIAALSFELSGRQ